MSFCATCAKPFGFWNREFGCPRCKIVNCKKCLVKTKFQGENITCCLKCSKNLDKESPQQIKQREKEDIENLLKLNKDEEYFEPVLEPFQQNNASTSENIDNDIKSRLAALKADENLINAETKEAAGNVDEIAKRLAELKGVENYSTNNNISLVNNDKRSDVEKVNDLLEQIGAEAAIDSQSKPEDEEDPIESIERRLANLRGYEYKKDSNLEEPKEMTESEEISQITQRYLDEAKIDNVALDPDEEEILSTIPEAPKDGSLDELPFCEICNEDSTLRCLECENLFCVRCYKEFHDEEDYKTHRTKPYTAPKKNIS